MTDDPYHDGGTRGSSGGGASADAAHADLVKGVTNAAQRYVVIMAQQASERGITVAEGCLVARALREWPLGVVI